jgi:hypothetical protein
LASARAQVAAATTPEGKAAALADLDAVWESGAWLRLGGLR